MLHQDTRNLTEQSIYHWIPGKMLDRTKNPLFLKMCTLPETNIATENGWLESYFPFGMAYFQGLC